MNSSCRVTPLWPGSFVQLCANIFSFGKQTSLAIASTLMDPPVYMHSRVGTGSPGGQYLVGYDLVVWGKRTFSYPPPPNLIHLPTPLNPMTSAIAHPQPWWCHCSCSKKELWWKQGGEEDTANTFSYFKNFCTPLLQDFDLKRGWGGTSLNLIKHLLTVKLHDWSKCHLLWCMSPPSSHAYS